MGEAVVSQNPGCFDVRWTERRKRSPAVVVTASGRRGFLETFGIKIPEETANTIRASIDANGSQSP
jgi:hypothetical protein